MAVTLTSREREKLGQELYALRAPAVALARRVLGAESAAEDACAEAYVRALSRIDELPALRELRPWFLRVVLNAARNLGRAETARRRREEAIMPQTNSASPAELAERRELAAAASQALQELEENSRLPLALHYEQGLSHAEVAAVLEVPAGTVASDISRGLSALRERLARRGFAAVPAAALAGALGAGGALPVPAALSAQISSLLAGKLGTGIATASTAAKGGLAVKIIAGVVAAGVLAGAVAVLNSVGAGFKPAPTTLASPPAAGPNNGQPAPVNEYKGTQDREEVFEFAQKPAVAKDGEKWTITFASKGKCDATVTILGPDGKVVRRLASGVLGVNAPYPFQQNSLAQKIEWDGLTDMFQKAPAGCKVKVSLGIQAKFERNLVYDHYDMEVPGKQGYRNGVRLAVAEGSDGSRYLASIRSYSAVGKVYDKDGKYVRTFMPPPAAELEKVAAAAGRKLVATKWGDKVTVPGWFGPWLFLGKALEEDTSAWPDLLNKMTGQSNFKLLGKAKASGDAKQLQEESRPGWLPPAKSTFAFCDAKYVHAGVNPENEDVFLNDLRVDGKTGEFFQMPNIPDPFETAVGPDGLLYALTVRGAYLWRVDREGKAVPFKDGVPIPRNESGPSKGRITGTWWMPKQPDMTVILTGGTCGTSGCMKNGFSVSPAGIAMGMVEFTPAFLAEHNLKKETPYVSVYSPDGKRLTVNAVGPMSGHGITIDRDGSLYVAYTGLPDGQKVLDGMDPSSAGSGHPGKIGAGSLVKYRGLGGKFPLNVGPGQKFTGGKELSGTLWAYGGIVGQTGASCGCGHVRVVIDGWARNWIPANHLCSVTVIDSNGNRIARFGRYGNVDDTEADLKAGRDGLRFCWPRAVVASDTALYVVDVGNRRILKAALSYAAEETVPAP